MVLAAPAEVARRLRRPERLRVLRVVAHPDDESLGPTWLYREAARVAVLCLTDGAPRDATWRPQAEGAPREVYAARRRAELAAALDLAGVAPEDRRQLAVADQEAVERLEEIVAALGEEIARRRPDLVVAHAYEGGHPDHDAAALAAARAAAAMAHEVALAEAPYYHRGADGAVVAGRFLPAATDRWRIARPLDPEAAAFRRRLLACHASQAPVLRWLPEPAAELLRPAPTHDFSRPPHPGPLHYEALGFPLDGSDWRARAAPAAAAVAPRAPMEPT